MPYRRLPNTDAARVYALQKAVEMEGYRENGELVLSYETTQQAKEFLLQFKRAHDKYLSCHDLHSKSSKSYGKELYLARLYVSHFIQVLNMTIMRGELKKEIKEAYGLPIDSYTSPDLQPESAVQEWGAKIIPAEEERTRKGGVPIYSPTIAKVKVHWGIFNDHFYSQIKLRNDASQALEEVTLLRPQADDIILDIWNQVETRYCKLPWNERMAKCKPFGLIYYLRKKEKINQKATEVHPTFDF